MIILLFLKRMFLVCYLCGTLNLFIIITQYGSTGYIGTDSGGPALEVCTLGNFHFHLQLAVIWTLDATCSNGTDRQDHNITYYPTSSTLYM